MTTLILYTIDMLFFRDYVTVIAAALQAYELLVSYVLETFCCTREIQYPLASFLFCAIQRYLFVHVSRNCERSTQEKV